MVARISDQKIAHNKPIKETIFNELGFVHLQTYTLFSGVSLGEGTGATMSDDEDDLQMDFSLDQSGADGHDMMGFGPLLPTESERSLMERVRHELKIELKQVIIPILD